ncbi:hypothetical protein [Empedobacter tilapiae]|uniref:Uncharacterized protein n=1 Tax=Empedobacter tilapiae TaxID=2491114 RepID=A0A4Z1AXK3_9FLAO|nr:hypothetical protein [Empedobacter tilapiae]TGN21936.1 hypothetical protein E4J94_16725 [Empedobacter tilapiae]
MALKWLNKKVVFLFIILSYHVDGQNYLKIYNDSIPNHIEFKIKDVFFNSDFDFYEIRKNKEYSIIIMGSKNQFKKFDKKFGYKELLRIVLLSHRTNQKIGLISYDEFSFKRKEDKIILDKQKTLINIKGGGKLETFSNPILLNNEFKIKEITSVNENNILIQNINKPCELKIVDKPLNMSIEKIFDLFENPNFEVEKSDGKLLFMYNPFSDWEIGHLLDN